MSTFHMFVVTRFKTKEIQVTVAETEQGLGDSVNVCAYHPGNLHYYYTTMTCHTPMIGRHVQVQQMMSNARLLFYEIEVHGY